MNKTYKIGNKLKQAITVLLVSAFVLLPTTRASADVTTAKDVHEVADICMYSQRVLKDYALIGLGVLYHDPKADLIKNIKVIDEYFADLKSHNLVKELDDSIKALETSWLVIEPIMLQKPDKKSMAVLYKKVEKFNYRCQQIADNLAQDTHIKGLRDLVLITKIGMESQRLAALYMMRVWGVSSPNYKVKVRGIVDELNDIIKELLAEDEKYVSEEIKKELRMIKKEFILFKFMALSNSKRFVPILVEKKASNVYEIVRRMVDLEKELLKLKY